MSRHDIDVLVVGGGGAACRAAISAADCGARVGLVVKGELGKCGATAYKASEMAGFNVADGQVDPADSPQTHFEDIMTAASGMADPQLARIVAEEAPLALKTLEDWGVIFERADGKYLEFVSCFATRPRTHVIKGHGEPIMRALIAELKKRGITVYEKSLVTDLFIHGGECVGVGILDRTDQYRACAAGAVVLATGGAGQLFSRNLNPPDICGDGYTLAHTAGAQLLNMEFIQAGIGFSHPLTSLFMAWLWSAHPRLSSISGKVFLADYLPPGLTVEDVMDAHAGHFPFSSSDVSRYIEIAVQTEITEGRGTPEQGISIDLSLADEYMRLLPSENAFCKMWPITRNYLRSRGVDVLRQPVQIACFAHAVNGGIRIDPQGATTIPGLYAAGEVAGGPHGADRLGGNMMVTCQVFGARAGLSAAKYARANSRRSIPTLRVTHKEEELQAQGNRRIAAQGLRNRLQLAAQLGLLVRRSQQGLEKFLNIVSEIRRGFEKAPMSNCWDLWELHSLLRVGEIMAKAAHFRQESRGSHFRTDFPLRDNTNFGKPLIIMGDRISFSQ